MGFAIVLPSGDDQYDGFLEWLPETNLFLFSLSFNKKDNETRRHDLWMKISGKKKNDLQL